MGLKRTLLHLFVPHHTNNHRAKALHVDMLSVYLLFFLVFNLATRFIHAKAPDVLGYATDIYVEQLLAATNAMRAENGLGTLRLNTQLSAAAAAKAQNMLAENYWAHNSPSGKTPWSFINAVGYRYTVAGENLAKNFQSSQGVVDAWMNSPSHRDNIVKPGYRDVGFAVVNGILNGEETTLVVQMFGSTSAAPAVQAAEAVAQPAAAVPDVQPVQRQQPVKPVEIVPQSAGITVKPFIDVGLLSKALVYAFLGVMLCLLAVDAAVISRKRIVRAGGHSIGHFLFLTAVFVLTAWSAKGSIL